MARSGAASASRTWTSGSLAPHEAADHLDHVRVERVGARRAHAADLVVGEVEHLQRALLERVEQRRGSGDDRGPDDDSGCSSRMQSGRGDGKRCTESRGLSGASSVRAMCARGGVESRWRATGRGGWRMERAGVVAGLHPLGERRDLLLTLQPDGELCAAFVRCVAFGRLYSYSYSYSGRAPLILGAVKRW